MKFSVLWKVLDESELSPEQLAPYFGVGNMTLRRWKKLAGSAVLPKAYEPAIVDGIYLLVKEEKVQLTSPAVQAVLQHSSSHSFEAIIQGLGAGESFLQNHGNYEDRVSGVLSQIGMSGTYRKEVDQSEAKLKNFKKLGTEWHDRVSQLWKVVRSSTLTPVDKLVAYGALFYLIFPFDLIPDHLPIIGLLDDFAVLGMAATYYSNRLTKLHGPKDI